MWFEDLNAISDAGSTYLRLVLRAHHDRVAVCCERLRDAATHRTGADDADCLDVHARNS